MAWDVAPSASETDEQVSVAAPAGKVDADRFGVGWIERDGVFESYNERVRFRRRPGWELLVDDMALLGHPSAGSGLYLPEDELSIYFILERDIEVPQQRYRELRREATFETFGTRVPDSSMRATFAGVELVFDGASRDHVGDECLHAVHFVDDDALQILVTHPQASDRERIHQLVRSALADVELMSESEVEAVRAELARGPDTQNNVGETWSLRRGVYRDFAHDLTWTSPGRDWVIQTGPMASRFSDQAVLVVQDRMASLIGRLAVYDDPRVAEADDATWHEAGVASFLEVGGVERVGSRRRAMMGNSEALVQTLSMEFAGIRGHYVLATSKHGSIGVSWLIGPEREVESHPALIDAVFSNTRFEPRLVEAAMEGSRWIDRRLGYSLEIPSDHQRVSGKVVMPEAGTETFGWGSRDGSSAIGVLVYYWAFSGVTRDELLVDTEKFFTELWGPAAVLDASLDGEPGKHLHWDSPPRDMLIVNRDYTQYALMSQSNDPELFARARESFAFVD